MNPSTLHAMLDDAEAAETKPPPHVGRHRLDRRRNYAQVTVAVDNGLFGDSKVVTEFTFRVVPEGHHQ